MSQSCLSRAALATIGNNDVSQAAIVDVDDTFPCDRCRIDVEPPEMEMSKPGVVESFFVVDPTIDSGGEQIMGGAHGVNVAGKVEIELVHGYDLGIATTSATSLHAEGGSLRWLTDRRYRAFADVGEGLSEADSGHRLAFAQLGGRHGGDDHVSRLASAADPVQYIEMDLRFVPSVQIDLRICQSQLAAEVEYRSERCSSRNLKIAFHGYQSPALLLNERPALGAR